MILRFCLCAFIFFHRLCVGVRSLLCLRACESRVNSLNSVNVKFIGIEFNDICVAQKRAHSMDDGKAFVLFEKWIDLLNSNGRTPLVHLVNHLIQFMLFMLFVTAPWGCKFIFSIYISTSTFHPFSRSISFFPDIVNSKLGMPRPQIGQSISQQGFFSSRDSLSVPCVSQPLHSYSATTSDMDLSRKNESKSCSKLKPGEQPLLGSWNPSTAAPRESMAHPTATSASTNHLTSNNGNGVNSNSADRWEWEENELIMI